MPGHIITYLKNYFSITKKEWNGMVVLVVLIIIALAVPYFYTKMHQDSAIDPKVLNEAFAKIGGESNSVMMNAKAADGKKHFGTLKFNPNHLSAAQWGKMGLTPQQITIIQHYEAKGGRFYRKEDLKKIYSITDSDYARLAPQLNIPATNAQGDEKPAAIIELNTADSARLTQARGIGPAFAMRILHYRDRLGGFLHKQQLKEVFGIDEGKYKEISSQFKVNARYAKKIDINAVSFEGLKNNPYLNIKQANAIVMYRKEHGNYETLAEMKNIAILDDGILRKIAPYLVFK